MSDEWVTNSTARKRCTTAVRKRQGPCSICGQPIDYRLRWPNARSFSVQHRQSRKARPDLIFDPTNLEPAHLDCNQSQGQAPVITERVTSRRW